MLKLILLLDLYQAVVFAVFLLFTNLGKQRSKRILGWFFLLLFVHYAARQALEVNDRLYQYFEYFTFPIALILFPLFNTYVATLVGCGRSRSRLFIHSIPAVSIGILYAILFGAMSLPEKLVYFQCSYTEMFAFGFQKHPASLVACFTLFVLLPLQVIFYTVDSLRRLFRHRKMLKDNFSSLEQKQLTWLFSVTLLFCVVTFAACGMIFISSGMAETFYFLISLPVFAAIGIYGIVQPPIYREESVSFSPVSPGEPMGRPEKQLLAPDNPTENQANLDLKAKLETYFVEKRPFIDPELSIVDIARALGTNKTYISRLLNNTFGENFYSFVNKFRIEEAKKRLSDPASNNLSVEGIASLSGFRSPSSFYSAFKALEGSTPSVFRLQVGLNGAADRE